MTIARASVLAAVLIAAASAAFAAPPTKIGSCVKTRISELGSRLEGDPDSGSSVAFENGAYQVSYDVIAAVRRSKVGDPVVLCLVGLPTDCPAGDDRGRVYSVTNLRVGLGWVLPDASHSCGGA